ncbi:hypothetical protein PtrSN002B_010335 [Pyrenophora tritici-repentis]|uniref:Uncharacterized protein n=1 Tax=Pyrenophora tritici-repentis TaxID=45151 RepID=A0A317AAX1_9PLEO|nr:hypothetical protein PtrV1_00194 [Pyrenophora tritici-repentis]KAF7575955.1 hypothetical protein PtrM4_001950 [Pyrenophora tritici-repentis]KAG9377648.1 hypothetical protein A1F94_012051 [Pyrenophora tritici-repentis]KAI0571654.1 hypothetical protein Alg215_10265 [Pyrenophora tritici-repentis]KAI0574540.1 hypothetical protein Alg130_09645 [Pyrenophora tritici-repentis]
MATSLLSIFIRISPSLPSVHSIIRGIGIKIPSYMEDRKDQATVRTNAAKTSVEWKKRKAETMAAKRAGKTVKLTIIITSY